MAANQWSPRRKYISAGLCLSRLLRLDVDLVVIVPPRSHGDSMGAKKKRKRSSWSHTVTMSTAVSTVLDNDDLLGEILLRLALPTSVVRASIVCRHWLHIASDPDFLDRFYDRHPSRLLGFYVEYPHLGRLPEFAPMPGLPPELAASIRRASSALDAYVPGPWPWTVSILDCLNGHLLVRFGDQYIRRDLVLSPMDPGRGTVIVPPLPPSGSLYYDNVRTGLSYHLHDGSVTVCASRQHRKQHHHQIIDTYELRDGAWHKLSSAPEIQLPQMPKPYIFVPFGDKIHLVSSASAIAEFRSASSSSETAHLSLVALPDGVKYEKPEHKRKLKAWADDSVICLIQVRIKKLQLRAWVYRMDSETWSLEDTICLRSVLAGSGVTTMVSQDGGLSRDNVVIRSVGPRHTAMCVLLQLGTDFLYIDIKNRTAEKAYTMKPEDGDSITIVPFNMIFPP
ncbi:hypothetical protein EJB05_27535, partial [Eragrostis curvula]